MRLAAMLLFLLLMLPLAHAAEHAVVLVYHHVSSDTPASTSVTPEEFARHLHYLDEHGFTVLALGDIVRRFDSGGTVLDKTVAITFDDAYVSVLNAAAPALQQRDWPFSVFVSTDAIDQKQSPYLSWSELRELQAMGAEIGNHTASHGHMIRRGTASASAWISAQEDDLRQAQKRLQEELGVTPTMVAFPYGEYDADLLALVEEMDLHPVGQHSGAVSPRSRVVPRFPVSSRYADLSTLQNKLSSVAFDLESVEPQSGVLSYTQSRPSLTLHFRERPANAQALTCFVAGQEPAEIQWSDNAAIVRAHQALRPGRTKYNCTLPALARPGRFHWFSFLWMKPESATSWYRE